MAFAVATCNSRVVEGQERNGVSIIRDDHGRPEVGQGEVPDLLYRGRPTNH